MIIVVRCLLLPTLIPNVSPKVVQQLLHLPLIKTFLINKNFYSSLLPHFNEQQSNYITLHRGKRQDRYFGIKNKCNLSKAMSGEGDQNLIVNYNDILEAQEDKTILIIDIRENYEIEETGKLPGSIHIPMKELIDVLTNSTDEDFENKFNRKRPTKDSKIIVSCKLGGRSLKSQIALQDLGYKNVYNYSGGWLDWENHQKDNK